MDSRWVEIALYETIAPVTPFYPQLGCRVTMEVDHAGCRLALLLTDAEGRGAELATLSGGERTFLRTMLVAALWELAPAPFRALDEFEVFLDPAARAEAARRLVEVALNKDSFQFLFIRWVPGGLLCLVADPCPAPRQWPSTPGTRPRWPSSTSTRTKQRSFVMLPCASLGLISLGSVTLAFRPLLSDGVFSHLDVGAILLCSN